MSADRERKTVLIVAVPETAGSALYGMVDVLAAAGSLWQQMTGAEAPVPLLDPKIASPTLKPLELANGIPVRPTVSIADNPAAPIIVLPELWLAPDEDFGGRYPQIASWIVEAYRAGAWIYMATRKTTLLWSRSRTPSTAITMNIRAIKSSSPPKTWPPAPWWPIHCA